MDILLIVCGVTVWATLGVSGFIFTWTSTWDFTTSVLFLATMSAVIGPFSWLAGYFTHRKDWGKDRWTRNPFDGKVLIPCRFGPGAEERGENIIEWVERGRRPKPDLKIVK